MRSRLIAGAAAGAAVAVSVVVAATFYDRPQGVPRPTESGTPRAGAIPTPALSAVPHPISLEALMRARYDGRDLRLGRVLARNTAYTRHVVTYRSGDLTISGIMNVPRGDGPFPVLILAHGHIDTAIYVNGQGLRREQDYLARRGYVVLHTDYRNHAQSDDDPNAELGMRLGYTVDVINAVYAVRASSLPFLDGARVGILGRSMGGGVALNVAVVQPDLVNAIVLFAPVSSDAVDNFNRWIRRDVVGGKIIAAYGKPDPASPFWRGVSPVTFFDRVRAPILVHHGTHDESVPIAWTRRTVRALERLGKSVRFYVYEGERHAFGSRWPESMRRTVRFLDRTVKNR